LEQQPVVIEVFNDARVRFSVLAAAEKEVGRIFQRAGVAVSLVNCGGGTASNARSCAEQLGPLHLSLRVRSRSLRAADDVFGVAFLGEDGTGVCSDVFLSPAQELHAERNLGLADVLGHVMAHEMGHLLLGLHAHSPMGIMRARWEGAELRKLGAGNLLFTQEQSRLMRMKVSARVGSKAAG
jgi:hypothetical protein